MAKRGRGRRFSYCVTVQKHRYVMLPLFIPLQRPNRSIDLKDAKPEFDKYDREDGLLKITWATPHACAVSMGGRKGASGGNTGSGGDGSESSSGGGVLSSFFSWFFFL